MNIEDIILEHDRRGVSALRPHLPKDYCDQAASLILESPGTVLIVTGFYILSAAAAETDGPPGAIAIGEALEKLGYQVKYVTDIHTSPILKGALGEEDNIIDFPISDNQSSLRFANDILEETNPSLLISIERCGVTKEGNFLNMLGKDISQFNAKTDYLFQNHPNTIGIGDGGNEIGMGNLSSIIPTVPSLVKQPSITKVEKLIISSVSNWGGYGLVASLSRCNGINLLPSVEAEKELVTRIVDLGAVDGITSTPTYKVDGFTLDENSVALKSLHTLLSKDGIV